MDTTDGGSATEGRTPSDTSAHSAARTAEAQSGTRRIRPHHLAILSAAVAATVVAGSAVGIAAADSAAGTAAASRSSVSPSIQNALRRTDYGSVRYGGFGGSDGRYSSGSGYGAPSGTASSGALASATAAQEVGVVDITSQLTYDQAESAGTGLVLSADGEILTNNHVVEGATSISVTIVSTGATYPATVVGTDATDDVAVLQLSGAAGLSLAHLDTSTSAVVGEAVTGVGNAGGAGGTPSASPGSVTSLDQTITTQAEATAASETLHGLIATDANIEAGDSGGPLFNSGNQVIGIDTAAEQGGATTAGYAIPIDSALSIAREIEAGDASSTVSIGYPAFLGVEVARAADTGASGSGSGYGSHGSGIATATAGAPIAAVIDGTPAAEAGLAAGDTITAVNGSTITSANTLTTALGGHAPGERVSISWTDATGASHSAVVTLARGPVA